MEDRDELPVLLRSPEIILQKIDNEIRPGKLVHIKIPKSLRDHRWWTRDGGPQVKLFKSFTVGFVIGVESMPPSVVRRQLAELYRSTNSVSKWAAIDGRVLYVLFGTEAIAFHYLVEQKSSGKRPVKTTLCAIKTVEEFKVWNARSDNLKAVPMFE